METVTRFAERHSGSVPVATTPGPEVARTLSVTAGYVLSEDGRKASLLAGGDGRAVQQITVQVPATRLHLVSVDKQGVARLKLRPRFETDGDERVVRTDAAPVYDAPPSIEDLYRAAARNHELERAFHGQRVTVQAKRQETEREVRERVAQAFLGDKAQRAVMHPAPSPKRCYVVAEHRRLLFDVVTDEGLAREIPPEAHKRFRADLRAKEERNHHERAAQLALHEEKKRVVAEWMAQHGSEEQNARQAAGVLPMDEALELLTDQAFAAIGDRPLYTRDGPERLQTFLREHTGTADTVVAQADVAVRSAHAVKATAAQWATVQALQALMPDASVTLREHVLSSRKDHKAPPLTVFGVLVTKKVGPFLLRREFSAPGRDA